MSKASESQRERWRRYRAMEKQRSEGFHSFVNKRQQRGQCAGWHDDSADRLLTLGELWDEHLQVVRKASTINEELASAMMFVRAFRTEGKSIVGITLKDLLRTLFREWCRAGRPLLNPIKEEFSREWSRQAPAEPPECESAWIFLDPPSAYDEPLLPVPVTAPKSAEQKFNEWARDNGKAPTAFFSSRVMPHADE